MAVMCGIAELSLERGFPYYRAFNPEQDASLERGQVRVEFLQEVPEGVHVIPGDTPEDPTALDETRIVFDARAVRDDVICGML